MASKRKSLCIDEKVLLIRAIEKGEKISDVAKRFGFSCSTVSTIWKNKEKILRAKGEWKSFKKLKRPKYEDLDQAMLLWLNQQRQNNMPISGPLVKAKAKSLAEELALTSFKASEGWLGKFKQRHHINYGKISGEARSIDTNVPYDWIDRVWSKFAEKYSSCDIFNAGEAEIFYKLSPDISLKFKGKKSVGGDLSKERITVLIAANMDGTEKRKLMVIGTLNPRCFKNITNFPVTYKANKLGCMSSQFFEEEVRKWDADLKGRKILLLVDNSPAHTFISNLQNIELAFLPSNSTSVLQPMNQGVLKSLKGHYKRKLLMELIESEGKTSVTLLHAINFLAKAWEEVTPTTVQNSFRHSGLRTNSMSDEVKKEPEFDNDELPLAEYLQTYMEEDGCLLTTASHTDNEISDSVRKTEDQEQGDEEDEPEPPESPPSIKEALKAVKILEKYFLYHQNASISQDMNNM